MKYDFTDDTRRALAIAREEALRLLHDYVGTEHILLGLTRLEGLLPAFGVEAGAAAERVKASVRPGTARIPGRGQLPYTSRAKKVLEFAMAEARELEHGTITSGHLLLGILREEKGIGAQVLASLGLELEEARRVLTSGYPIAEAATPRRARRKLRGSPSFRIVIDDASSSSIYEQIVDQVREAVATGALEPGHRLQTVRSLADELDIAPGTVARAYAELERLGVVVTEGARGTRVAEPRRSGPGPEARLETLTGLLRPVAVAAYHMGGSAAELREALEAAMRGILGTDAEAS